MQIGVALAMRVAHHVDGNAVDVNREISAMVGVKSAEKNLIGLAAAVVLSEYQSGHQPQHIGRRSERAKLEVACPKRLLGCCRRRLLPPNVNFYRL